MATTADYLNKLVTQKNALADNLVEKGIDATHDETLDTLVPKILDINGESDKYSIYNNGQELNGNTVTLYHVNHESSEKTASWIYMYYWYRGVIETSQLSLAGYKKIGVCLNLKRNGTATPFFTKISLRSSGNVELSGNDYVPVGNIIGTEYALIDNTIDSTVTKYEGIYYIDIPEEINNGYFVIDSVNVDVYVISIWLEKKDGIVSNNNKAIPDIYNHGDVVGLNNDIFRWNPTLPKYSPQSEKSLIQLSSQPNTGAVYAMSENVLSMGKNANQMWYIPVLINAKGYKYLCVDAKVSNGTQGRWNVSTFGVMKSLDSTQGGCPSTDAYYRFTDSYISEPYNYSFERQVVKIDIEKYDDITLFAHCCDCQLDIYSIFLSND